MAGHICSAANFIIQSVHRAQHKHTHTHRLGNAAICVKFTQKLHKPRNQQRERDRKIHRNMEIERVRETFWRSLLWAVRFA